MFQAETTDSDGIRAAEIDKLVESGNWDVSTFRCIFQCSYTPLLTHGRFVTYIDKKNFAQGVVAVAARYVDEADEAEEELRRPLRRPSSRVAESDVDSVSVETADDSSAFSRSSHDTYNLDEVSPTTASPSRSGTASFSSEADEATTISRSRSSATTSSSGIKTSSTTSSSSRERRRMNAYRAEVEALVRRVVPDELSNVDDILIQFSGREQELIETLRAMQEKSIAQRARAAVQRSAKMEAGSTGRSGRDSIGDESSEGISSTGKSGRDMMDDDESIEGIETPSVATQDPSEHSAYTDSENDEFSSSSGSRGGRTTTSSRSGVTDSGYSDGQTYSTSKVSYDTSLAGTGLSDAIDATDWRAVGANAEQLRGDGVSPQPSGSNGVDDMIDEGNWSGIIEAASNMTRKHRNSSTGSMGDID